MRTIGLDLGGTKLASALVDAKGKVLKYRKEPARFIHGGSDAAKSISNVVAQLADTVGGFLDDAPGKIKGVGLASAGPLDVERGELIHPTNFPGFGRVKIVSLLEKELQKRKIRTKVYFQNDAMAAALGEGWVGGAKGLETFCVVTVGTGIGSGMIYRGRPAQFHGMGGEWGLGMVDFREAKNSDEPHFGTVEGYASGTGILRRARDLGFAGASVEDLVAAIRAGDEKYRILFQDAALALASLCYNLSLGFHPEKILFFGGMVAVKDLFFDDVLKFYKKFVSVREGFATKIAVAKLGDKAGVIGAARLPWLK